VISLVPTQLQRLLARAEMTAWLREFDIIFVGGGPVWPELAEAAARAGLRVSLSYGMTESAAMVAALRPEEFLAGARSCGAALPHARIAVDAEGLVRIAGASVFHGYFPAGDLATAMNFPDSFSEVCHPIGDKLPGALPGKERAEVREFVTEDLGRIDERGHVQLLGRRDAVIITGGKKVQPAEVEAALRASGEFVDVAVIGVPDAEWGEAVLACYPAGERAPNLERAVAGLSGFQRPKQFVALADWPRNEQGKINRAALRARVAARAG
jgi:O-succinylbenzoic acid--CoA ligase